MTRAELLGRISVDPQVCFGKPCIRGHRVWVSLVLDELSEGKSVDAILAEHPGLSEDDVRACMAYGAEASRNGDVQAGEGEHVVSFWDNPTIEELIKAQKVAPADDLDAIAALWPADDDPDALLEHILSERRERRRVARDKAGSHA